MKRVLFVLLILCLSGYVWAQGNPIKVVKMSWHLGGFNTVFILDKIVIKNEGKEVRNFTIACVTEGKSETAINVVTKRIYDVLPAGKTKTFKNINMGFVSDQSARASCVAGERDLSQ